MSCCGNSPPDFNELNQYPFTKGKGWGWRTEYDQQYLAQYNNMTLPPSSVRAEFYEHTGALGGFMVPDYRTPFDKAFLTKYDSMAEGPKANRASF